MQLPTVLIEIIMDYHNQLLMVEMHDSLRQHLISLNMLEELAFAHRNYTTYELEFFGIPPNVIRNLNEIRGPYDPQDWNPSYLHMLKNYAHPKVQAIIDKWSSPSLGLADIWRHSSVFFSIIESEEE